MATTDPLRDDPRALDDATSESETVESETAARIRQIGLELFSTQGFAATSMRDLAASTGVSTAALYYHYEGKDALLDAIVDPFLDAVDALLDRVDETDLEDFLSEYLDLLIAHHRVVRFLDWDLSVRSHPVVGPRADDQAQRISKRLTGPDPDDAAVVRATAAHGVLRRPVQAEGTDLETARKILVDAALGVLDTTERP